MRDLTLREVGGYSSGELKGSQFCSLFIGLQEAGL